MVVTIDVFFDGKAFQQVQPIQLPANTRVQIAVTTAEDLATLSFLDLAESLALIGHPTGLYRRSILCYSPIYRLYH